MVHVVETHAGIWSHDVRLQQFPRYPQGSEMRPVHRRDLALRHVPGADLLAAAKSQFSAHMRSFAIEHSPKRRDRVAPHLREERRHGAHAAGGRCDRLPIALNDARLRDHVALHNPQGLRLDLLSKPPCVAER